MGDDTRRSYESFEGVPMADERWYFCLRHHAVEPYQGCKAETRLGPYATPAEAEHALDRVRERNEAWDTDPRFADDDDEDAR